MAQVFGQREDPGAAFEENPFLFPEIQPVGLVIDALGHDHEIAERLAQLAEHLLFALF